MAGRIPDNDAIHRQKATLAAWIKTFRNVTLRKRSDRLVSAEEFAREVSLKLREVPPAKDLAGRNDSRVALSKENVFDIEKGKGQISLRLLTAIGNAFDVPEETYTDVYHNWINYEDSGLPQVQIVRTERVSIVQPRGLRWSAKGIETVTRLVSAQLAGAMMFVQIEDDLFPATRKQVLVFQESDYPSSTAYLLLRHKTNKDDWAIRHIDPSNPARLICPGVEQLLLADYDVMGFLGAVLWGNGDRLDEGFMSLTIGIGPNYRQFH